MSRNARRLGVADDRRIDDLSGTVGNLGTAHPLAVLTAALETASPGETIALMTLADGVEVMVLRTTDAIADFVPARSIAEQIATGGSISYAQFLSWQGLVAVEPPNRPCRTAHRRRRHIVGTTGSSALSAAVTAAPA